jgi:CNT family concentrative nucleoside transporter
VLVVGALSALFYHWGILPAIVRVMAAALQRLFGIGGAAGFGVAANVFVGMVEAPLMIRAWLARMTRAELFVVMTAGLATISGNTLVVYALMIAPVVPDAAIADCEPDFCPGGDPRSVADAAGGKRQHRARP